MVYSLQNSGSLIPTEVFQDQVRTVDYWMAEVIYCCIQYGKKLSQHGKCSMNVCMRNEWFYPIQPLPEIVYVAVPYLIWPSLFFWWSKWNSYNHQMKKLELSMTKYLPKLTQLLSKEARILEGSFFHITCLIFVNTCCCLLSSQWVSHFIHQNHLGTCYNRFWTPILGFLIQ